MKVQVANEAFRLFEEHMKEFEELGKYSPYKASGMAYIDFASKESELFKMLFMRDRRNEKNLSNRNEEFLFEKMSNLIQSEGIASEKDADIFHLEMWACVHGIAVMAATGFLNLQSELVSAILTDCFKGLVKRHNEKGEGN